MTVFESNLKTQNCKAHSTTLDNRDLISCKFNPRWKNTKKSRGQGQQDKKDKKTIKEKQKHKEEQEQQGEKNKKNKKKSKKKKNKKNKNNKERRTRTPRKTTRRTRTIIRKEEQEELFLSGCCMAQRSRCLGPSVSDEEVWNSISLLPGTLRTKPTIPTKKALPECVLIANNKERRRRTILREEQEEEQEKHQKEKQDEQEQTEE